MSLQNKDSSMKMIWIEYFEAIAGIIRDSKVFDAAKINIATITVDKSGIKMEVEYVDKNARMYKIKKEWEQNNIEC